MFSQKQFIVIFTTSLWIQLVTSSIELKKVDDPNDIRIAKKLVKYLDSKINVIPKININQVNDDTEASQEPVKTAAKKQTLNLNTTNDGDIKKILIKRVVPHGLQVPRYEHDYKYNTLYKPLYRVHKNRQQNPMIRDENMKNFENKIELTYVPISPDAKAKQFKPHLHNYKYLLHPFIHNLMVHKMKWEQSFDDEGRKYLNFLLKYLKLKDFEELLRGRFGKSGEVETATVKLSQQSPPTTTRKPLWRPKYPAWNYWTYKKQIYQDSCPGLQINVGGVCTWIPPH